MFGDNIYYISGYKKTNQDRCTAFSYLDGDPDLGFFAVYDGHGGTGVANYLKDHLHEFILAQPEYRCDGKHVDNYDNLIMMILIIEIILMMVDMLMMLML